MHILVEFTDAKCGICDVCDKETIMTKVTLCNTRYFKSNVTQIWSYIFLNFKI